MDERAGMRIRRSSHRTLDRSHSSELSDVAERLLAHYRHTVDSEVNKSGHVSVVYQRPAQRWISVICLTDRKVVCIFCLSEKDRRETQLQICAVAFYSVSIDAL